MLKIIIPALIGEQDLMNGRLPLRFFISDRSVSRPDLYLSYRVGVVLQPPVGIFVMNLDGRKINMLTTLNNFIRLIREERVNLQARRTPSRLALSFFDSIEHVPVDTWNQIVPENRALMRHPYLRAIEMSAQQGEQSRYVLFFKDKTPVAAAIFKIALFSGRDYRSPQTRGRKIEKISDTIKEKTRLRVLVCGHTHISGDHGFIYSDAISCQEAYHALADACYQIRRAEKLRGKISLQLIKDFYEGEYEASKYLKVFKYRQFKVDPNMVLKIRAEWKSFEDYLQAMNTKYRKKALTVVKQGTTLERRSLSAAQIEAEFDKIQRLYLNVADKATVRINHFDTSYLFQLKRHLPDQFNLVGYFHQGEMIAFSTTIAWGNNLEGHAIGINYDYNTSFALYQNILYDFVKAAIEGKRERVILGRTAMEMKSNIGAEPLEMCCYIRHSAPLLNRAFKPVFSYIRQAEWVQRNPFKEKAEVI